MKQTVAIVLAGFAALITVFTLQFFAKDPASAVHSFLGPREIRLIMAIVFFTVLLLVDRQAFKNKDAGNSFTTAKKTDFMPGKTPLETSDDMARIFSGVTDDASRQRAIREWLMNVLNFTVLIPFIFYLRFGAIGPLGWGLTVFFDVYCLLWALGLYFRPRTEYHSPVKLRGDWLDHIGAFWLVACAFGPFFGWIVTEALPITQSSWHWLYGLRVFLAAGIPILLALPLLRYVRGKSTAVALPLLLLVTLLPVSTAMHVSQDLWEGPSLQNGELYLKHTERNFGKK